MAKTDDILMRFLKKNNIEHSSSNSLHKNRNNRKIKTRISQQKY